MISILRNTLAVEKPYQTPLALASNQRVGLQTRDGKKQLKIQMEFQLLNLKTFAWHIESDKKSKLFLFSLM